jgi:hypothetical protein
MPWHHFPLNPCLLTPFSLESMSFDTISTLTTLHPELNNYFSFFPKDYEPNQDLEFSSNSFKLAFQHMPHMLASGLSGMVFEQLWDCFHLGDLMTRFL